MKMKWYAVYTKPRCEKKVAEILNRKKIENYCPLNRVERYWSGSKKLIEEPLFTNYIFVRGTELQHSELKKTYGIVNLVYWLGKPVVVTDLEIETIRRFLNNHINVIIEKTTVNLDAPNTKVSHTVRERETTLITVKNKKLCVILSSIGYIISAEVETPDVELILSESQPSISKVYPINLLNYMLNMNN